MLSSYHHHDPWGRQLADPHFPNFSGGALTTWSPVADITENEKEVMITCELPGLKKDQLNVELTDKVLKISGERSQQKSDTNPDHTFSRYERSYGKFVRSFTLPDNVRPETVKASFDDGLLQVRVEKNQETQQQRKRITIS